MVNTSKESNGATCPSYINSAQWNIHYTLFSNTFNPLQSKGTSVIKVATIIRLWKKAVKFYCQIHTFCCSAEHKGVRMHCMSHCENQVCTLSHHSLTEESASYSVSQYKAQSNVICSNFLKAFWVDLTWVLPKQYYSIVLENWGWVLDSVDTALWSYYEPLLWLMIIMTWCV